MRNRILTLAAVFSTAILYYFVASAFSSADKTVNGGNGGEVQTLARDTFTNCILNTDYNTMLARPVLNLFTNLDSFKALNFNAVHWYDWAGSDVFGKVLEYLSSDQIKHFQDSVKKVNDKGLLGFYERANLSYYIYGQRLIYEVSPTNNNTGLNYGFVYKQCMDSTYTMDGNRTVLHADTSLNKAGYLCKDIHENLQHTDLLNFRQDDKGLWYLKPVMKIPQNTADTTRVVRIEIMAFDNKDPNPPHNQIPIKEIIIKAGNFSDTGYVEKYIDLFSPNNLQIPGDNDSLPCLSKGITQDWWYWDTECHVDFRVYWYGECDVWFDKMIVDDNRANDLFDPFQQIKINKLIYDEVTNFTDIAGNYSFFTDEVLISQVPCMKYVFGKIREYKPNARISFATTDNLHIRGLKHDDLPYTIYFNSLQPNFYQHDVHKFEVWEGNLSPSSYALVLPNTIPEVDRDPLINPEFFKPAAEYNSHLQSNALGYKHKEIGDNEQGSLIYEIYKIYDSKPSGTTGVKFIIQPQIHGYLKRNPDDSFYEGGLREPTNEEIQVEAALSIAHGADGLCWYIYGSELYNYNSNQKTINGDFAMFPDLSNYNTSLYTYGLLDLNGTKRHHNCYGQDKWTYVSQLNGKILKWADVLNNADWKEGFSVHQEGANHNYINDIRSKAPLRQGANSECLNEGLYENYDCPEDRYWELLKNN